MTILTAYLTATNDTLLTTARQLASTAPAAEASVASGQFAKSATGWTELYAQGGNATLAGVEPAPSDHGFLFDVTTLEAKQIAAGNWTPTIKLSTGGGTFTATIVVRAWKRSTAGVYTQIGGDMSLAAVALSSTATAHAFAAASRPAMTFDVGDRLYIDVLLNITTGSTSNTASQRVVNLFENGGANDAVVTPGYQPLVTASDAVAVSDTASRAAQSQVRSGPDSVTVAGDSAIASLRRARSSVDAVAISPDSASGQQTAQRSPVDAVSIADAASRAAQSQVRSGPDALTIGEQAGANIAAGRQTADVAAIADSAAGRSTLTHGSSDTVTIADIAPDAIAAARAAVDAIALTLTASSLVAPTRASLDSVTLGDVGIAHVMLGRTGVDTLSLSDVASEVVRGGGGQADDALSIVDDAQRAAQAIDRTVTDHATIGDQARGQAVSTRTTGDVVTFADIAVRAEPRARTSADAFGISDNATRGPASAVRYTADLWPVSDHAARLGSQARNADDAIALNDTAIAGEPPPIPPEEPFLHTEGQPRLHSAATSTLRTAGAPILHTEPQPRLHRERQPRTA